MKGNGLFRTETSIDGSLDLEAFLPKRNVLIKDSSIDSMPDFHSHWLPDGSVEPDHVQMNNSSYADVMAAIHQLQAEESETKKQEPPKDDEESSSEQEDGGDGSRKRKRGDIAKENKEVQDVAREGQKHWGEKVKALRQEWADRKMWEHGEEFNEQFRMCKRLKIKNQNECLLHQLQFSLADGLVHDVEYGPEDESFVGWKSFCVNSKHAAAAEFRERIRDMFGSAPSEKTLNNTLRRAGIVPQGAEATSPSEIVRKNHDWKSAWAGIVRFVFDQTQREKGKGSNPSPVVATE